MRTKIHNFDPDRKIGMFTVMEQFLLKGYSLEVKPITGNKLTMSVHGSKGKRSTVSIIYSDTVISTSKVFGKCIIWILTKKDEDRVDDSHYYVFVHFDKTTYKYRYFIVPNKEVSQYLCYEHKQWMESKSTHHENNMRTFRLGLFYEKYNFNVLMVSDYEDKWNAIES